jgi:hypothetical protein
MNPVDPSQSPAPAPPEEADDFKAMLIGAALMFVIAFVPYSGFLCCLPQISGALLAAHLFTNQYRLTLTYGEGIRLGILTALLGGVTAWVVATVLLLLANYQVGGEMINVVLWIYAKLLPADAVEKIKDQIAAMNAAGPSVGKIMIGFVASVVTAAISGLIGGSVGAAIFKRGPKEPGVR